MQCNYVCDIPLLISSINDSFSMVGWTQLVARFNVTSSLSPVIQASRIIITFNVKFQRKLKLIKLFYVIYILYAYILCYIDV